MPSACVTSQTPTRQVYTLSERCVCKAHPRSGSVVVLVLRVIRHIIHSSLYTTTTHTGGGGGGGVRDDSGSYRGAHDRGDDSDGCSILTLTSTSTLIWWFEPNSPVKGSPNIKGSFFLSKNSYMKFHRRNKKKKMKFPERNSGMKNSRYKKKNKSQSIYYVCPIRFLSSFVFICFVVVFLISSLLLWHMFE
jgi:hypothetical protein